MLLGTKSDSRNTEYHCKMITKSKGKTSNFKICKSITCSIFKCFQQLFCFFFILVAEQTLQTVLASSCDQKCPLRMVVLKTDVNTNAVIDFFTWKSFFGDGRLYLDAIK